MSILKTICLLFFVCGIFAEKLTDGVCVTKIVKGKFVSTGDCQKDVDASEIVRMIKRNFEKKQRVESTCDVTYNSKCFRMLVYSVVNITFTDARSLCKNYNYGTVADIYDFSHYNMLLSRIRSMYSDDLPVAVWTSVRYQDGQLVSTSGENIPIASDIWYPGYPYLDASRTNIAFLARENPNDEAHGIYNVEPSMLYNGVICEI
uniref:uncharacterized protein LOC120331766 isoform X2 n=1 Tax=Styela clava TaxID=7725 RepID=UPI0019392F6F|nr:uncharacterized protein LOC120331766 isoform X2 [Styela clava]